MNGFESKFESKKIAVFALAAFVFVLVFIPAFFSCVMEVDDTESLVSSSSTTASGSSFSASNILYVDLTNKQARDDGSSYCALSTMDCYFLSGEVSATFNESTGLLKVNATEITENLGIYITGTLSTGGVKIQSSDDYETGIYLDDVTISSSNYPCIDITKGGIATVFINGTNTLTDGRSYGTSYSDTSDNKGTLFCKGGLALCEGSLNDEDSDGTATLSVTQAYKNCIASKAGILTIESGTYVLSNYLSESTKTTKTGKNGLFGGQGIVVNSGNITFNGYGIIKKESSYYDIRKANAFKTDDEDYPESCVKITGGTTTVTTYNGKGITSPYVEISGGSNKFTITGVTTYSENSTKGSYYDADGVLQSSQTIKFAPEGIEGDASVKISGGSTIVSAPDDGINVSNTGGTLSISGGFVYVEAEGDGLDSNGAITISGGITVVSQNSNNNSPIDCGENYKFTVTGTSATVFAMGSTGMFNESIPSSTVIPMVYSTSCSGSSSLGVNDIIAVESPLTYGAVILISNSLTSGESYSFVKGGTLSGTLYNSDAKVYFPATITDITDGKTVTCIAKTSSSSSTTGGGNTHGGRP